MGNLIGASILILLGIVFAYMGIPRKPLISSGREINWRNIRWVMIVSAIALVTSGIYRIATG